MCHLSPIECCLCSLSFLPLSFFFFTDPPPTEIYTLSLHDALPISWRTFTTVWPASRSQLSLPAGRGQPICRSRSAMRRSEEHTSELQSRVDLVCRLLLEKKKKIKRSSLS